MTDKRRIIGLIITLICVSSNVYSADKIYTTNFSYTEGRISEGGDLWINGAATGVGWSNVKTSNGNATATQYRLPDGIPLYDDSAAVLKGNWGADQTAEAVVYAANQTEGGMSGFGGNEWGDCDKEVELHLRSTITPNNIKLYEILWSSRQDGNAYHEIVRWNGPLGDFTYLATTSEGWGNGVVNGDVVRATITGNTIRTYKNGVLMLTATDNTHTTGNPGIGFYNMRGCTGTTHNDDFGFTSFKATAPGLRIPTSPSIISIR
jgi:hypothetical protein